MATPKTINFAIRGADNVLRPGTVEVELSQPCTIPGAGGSEIVPSRVSVHSNAGTGTLSLYSTNDLTPNNTFFTVTLRADDGGVEILKIQVPMTAGPFELADLVTVPPTASPSPAHVSALTVDGAFVEGQQTPTEAVLVSGIDATLSQEVLVTLTANRVMGVPLNGLPGQKLHLIITQGGAGGFALTFGAGIIVSNFGLNYGVGSKTDAVLACIAAGSWVIASTSVNGQDIVPRSVTVPPPGGPYVVWPDLPSGGVAGFPVGTTNGVDQASLATIGLVGDSLTNNIGAVNGFQYNTGYWPWAAVRLGHRLDLTYIDGVPGSGCTTSGNWQTRVRTLAAQGCHWGLIEIGTNDVQSSASTAAITAALQASVDILRAAGMVVILLTIPPRNGLTGAQQLVWGQVNTWIRQLPAVRPGVVVADIAAYLADPASATAATYVAAYDNGDGIHPSPKGCKQIGDAIYTALNPLISPLQGILVPQSDSSNLITYAQSSWAGGGAAKPTGWTQASLVGATFSQTTVRPDGAPGVLQTVVVPAGISGDLHVPIGGNYTTGDRLVGFLELMNVTGVDAAPGANTQWFSLYLQAFTAAYAVAATTAELYRLNGTIANATPPTSGVLQTPTLVVPSNGLQEVDLFISINGGATYQFGRVGIIKVGSTYQ